MIIDPSLYSAARHKLREFFYRNRLIGVVMFIAILTIFIFYSLFFHLGEANDDSIEVASPSLELGDKLVLNYLEATSVIQQRALFLQDTDTRDEIFRDMIKSYLRLKDSYSQYLTAEELQIYKGYHGENYVGLGMELEKNNNGDILCYPYPGSAASEAGIKLGDRLLKINGEDVRDRSLFSIASMVRGEAGTKITLVIDDTDGIEKEFIIHLTNNELKTVTMSRQGNIPIIKISFFSAQTKMELLGMFSELARDSVVILDLRSNRGGDLQAAIESSDLFIPPGKTLATTIRRDGKESVYKSSSVDKSLQPTLLIWQDQSTASAAEVFIAALTENNRAVSIGVQSYGKGEKQDIVALSDGSALILTTGYITTPSGINYHGSGLKPSHVIESKTLNTNDYMKKVYELNGQTRGSDISPSIQN